MSALGSRFTAFAIVALLAFSVSGCALEVTAGNPRPNLALTPQTSSMTLVLGNAIFDKFEIPSEANIYGGHVEGWQTTLRNGFRNGFGDSFKLTPSPPADATLVIDDAQIEFVPAAVNGQGGVVAATAQVRYRATLLDRNGKIVRRAAGTASSKRSTTNRGEATVLAVSAVETMYEEIAQQLFGERAPKGG